MSRKPGTPVARPAALPLLRVAPRGVRVPVIELPDEPPLEGCETFGPAIVAVMIYPGKREATRRRNWQAAAAAYAYSDFKGEGAPWQMLASYHGWIGDLWKLRQAPARVFKDGTARMKRASLSGDMLEFLLRLAVHHPDHCQVQRVKVLLRELRGRKAPSESQLEKVWANFKTVSPLWLAFWKEKESGGSIRNDQRWLSMLARAEMYRRTAEDQGVLKPRETWRAAPALALPSPTIDLPALPEDQLAILDRDFPA